MQSKRKTVANCIACACIILPALWLMCFGIIAGALWALGILNGYLTPATGATITVGAFVLTEWLELRAERRQLEGRERGRPHV